MDDHAAASRICKAGRCRAVTCEISPRIWLYLSRSGWNRCSAALSEAVSLSIALWASTYYGRCMHLILIETINILPLLQGGARYWPIRRMREH